MRKGKGKGIPNTGGQAVPDLDFAVNLHRVVAQQLPRRIEVDNIPAVYLQTFWKPFPIPPEVVPAGPGGLAAVLQREFGHLLSFSQNRQGVWCADLVLPPETPLEEIARFHIDFRSSHVQPPTGLKAIAPQGQPSQGSVPSVQTQPPIKQHHVLQTRTLSKEEEASAQLITRGIHQTLLANPSVGEAVSMQDLQRQLQEAFYKLFRLPLVLASGLPVDPLELVRKNQQKSFSRILEDPMTGSTTVKAIGDNPQFVPIVSLLGMDAKGPAAVPADPLQAGMKQLRLLLAENMKLIDMALAGPVNVPDANLWKNALTTLVQQETQTRDILVNLFK